MFVFVGECHRPEGCTKDHNLYRNVDCDGDGILDHACSSTNSDHRWLVLSSEGCPDTWGINSRSKSDCPLAFDEGESHSFIWNPC